MKLELLTVCQTSAIDSRRNTLSLIHLLEDIGEVTLPIAVQVTVVAILRRSMEEEERPSLAIKITNDDIEILNTAVGCDFQGLERSRLMLEIGSLVISKPGILRFALLHGSNELGSWDVKVVAAAPSVTSNTAGIAR